jgi:hypothetical protein
MNRNFTQLPFFKSTITSFVLFLLTFFTATAQPDYDFRNAKLVSGTINEEGAIYLFENVKPGVDAFVTLSKITNGIILAEIDAGSGYPEALQPTLDTKSKKKGYVEMKIDFVYAGSNTPYLQKEVPITCIDVDGIADADGHGHGVHEFDEINMGAGSYVNYSMTGFELDVKQVGSWVTGKNIRGIDYPGRDTSATQVMFTVVNANISTATIRVGVDNSTSDVDAYRLRSVYFKKFVYANGLLAAPSLRSFVGVNKNNGITLTAGFTSTNGLRQVQLERAVGNNSFLTIAVMTSLNDLNFSFTDNAAGVVYYRLKLTGLDGQISYSPVLRFTGNEIAQKEFKVYPSVTSGAVTINIAASKAESSSFQLLDVSGRVVYQQPMQLQAGNNANVVNTPLNLSKGNYIAMVKTADKVYSQQIIKQ